MMPEETSQSARRRAWVAMSLTSFVVAAVTFFVFGVVGGFMLLVALNGLTERQAAPVFVVYFVVVLGGCTLVAALLNWLILRRGFPRAGLSGWAAVVPAVAASAGLLVVGPALSVVLMKVIF